MTRDEAQTIYDMWLRMWNGEPELADEIIAPDCRIHQAPFGPGESEAFQGPAGLARMIEQGRAPFPDLRFTLEVGPLVDGDMLAARWTGRGIYEGGIPGATARPGTPIAFSGIDIQRVEAGRIVEYWVSSDGAHLMA